MDLDELDRKYREDGWGVITDAALGIRPANVESQARSVARWAHDEIATLKAELAAANQLIGEMVDGLEPFSTIAQGEVWERFIADAKMNLRISNGNGSKHLVFINAECFQEISALIARAKAAS